MASRHSAATHCPDCEPYPVLRNHWFLGKLVTPRDLTDEHRYLAQKLRLHHQRLHGTGIVCGLEIRQHDKRLCQDRLVYLEPGSAIDCCGHDILVLERDVIDLEGFAAFRELVQAGGEQPHVLRLCLRYRECPTEEVPVLFDECACDDSECAPNRIFETYAVDLVIDPPDEPHRILNPRLGWRATGCAPGAVAVALDTLGGMLLALSGDTPSLVYRETLAELAPKPPLQLGRKGLAIAVEPGQKLLYAAVEPAAAGDPQELRTYDLAGPLTGPEETVVVPDSAGSGILLRCCPTGEVVSLALKGGHLALWKAGLSDPAPISRHAIGDATGLAIGGDGTIAYTLTGSPVKLVEARLDGSATRDIDLGGFAATDLDTVLSTAAELVVLVGGAELRLVDPATANGVGKVTLAHPAVAVAAGPGGQWAFVVEAAGGKTYLQTVDLHLLRSTGAAVAGSALELPDGVAGIVVSDTGDRLYLPDPGGVIVIEVDEADCAALLDGGDCPGCIESDCLTLATIRDWHAGARLVDRPDAGSTAEAGTAWIDNDDGRVWLPSTQAIAAALRCLMAHATGGSGLQGPPGKDGADGKDGKDGKDGLNGLPGRPGQDGQGIDRVELKLVDCEEPAAAALSGTSPARILTLTLPSCCTPERTRICDINWEHGADIEFERVLEMLRAGFVVSFDDRVRNGDINLATFRILASVLDEETGGLRWVQVRPARGPQRIERMPVGLAMERHCDATAGHSEIWDRSIDVDGMLYRADHEGFERLQNSLGRAMETGLAYLRVQVAGDLIRDSNDRPIDADHLPPWIRVPGVQGPQALSGDCVAGGTFESWLRIGLRG
jgi:hypothetical protein